MRPKAGQRGVSAPRTGTAAAPSSKRKMNPEQKLLTVHPFLSSPHGQERAREDVPFHVEATGAAIFDV